MPEHSGAVGTSRLRAGTSAVAQKHGRPSDRDMLPRVRAGCLHVVLLVFASGGLCGHALAQPQGGGEATPEGGETPENPEAAREAREHFQQGLEHFQAREYRDAVHEFQTAAALVPSADLWFNIARAYEELSEYEPAIENYRKYLHDRVDPPDRERIEQHITELEEQLEAARQARRTTATTGTLRVTTNVEGAKIRVDGRDVGESPLTAPLTVRPGDHQLEVEADGYSTFRAVVHVEIGMDMTAHAEMPPGTSYTAVRGSRLFTWIAAGLGGAALVTSIVLGVVANNQTNDALALPEDSMEMQAALDDARGTALASDVMLGVTVGMAVVAVVLYFIEGRAVGTERSTGPDLAFNF